jgi:hypothetical protein
VEAVLRVRAAAAGLAFTGASTLPELAVGLGLLGVGPGPPRGPAAPLGLTSTEGYCFAPRAPGPLGHGGSRFVARPGPAWARRWSLSTTAVAASSRPNWSGVWARRRTWPRTLSGSTGGGERARGEPG